MKPHADHHQSLEQGRLDLESEYNGADLPSAVPKFQLLSSHIWLQISCENEGQLVFVHFHGIKDEISFSYLVHNVDATHCKPSY